LSSASGSRRWLDGESILVLCFVVFAVLYFHHTLSFERTLMSDYVGPSMFPQLVAGVALLLSAIYFFQRFAGKAIASDGDRSGGVLAKLSALLPLVPVVLYVIILEPLGFLFATAIYVFVAMLLFGQTIVKSLVYAVTMAVAFFVLFYYVLLTQVPMGWLVETGRVMPFVVQIRRAIEG
jgi:putative tricarboxylic transport membrane protein